MEDAGALPIEVDVAKLNMGDVIDIFPYEGKIKLHGTEQVLAEFELKTDVLIDEVRAGGRIPLIIGRGLTDKAREVLGLPFSTVFRRPQAVADTGKGLHPGPEDGRQGVRRAGHSSRHLLRAQDDHGRLPGHHGPHDPR